MDEVRKSFLSPICCYKIVGVKRERGVILLGRFLAKNNPDEKGGHTPCQDLCGGQLFVMYVELLRKSMPLIGKETIGRPLGRHLRRYWRMKLIRRWSCI